MSTAPSGRATVAQTVAEWNHETGSMLDERVVVDVLGTLRLEGWLDDDLPGLTEADAAYLEQHGGVTDDRAALRRVRMAVAIRQDVVGREGFGVDEVASLLGISESRVRHPSCRDRTREPIAGVVPTIAEIDQDLWRVHRPVGTHPLRCNQFRPFGPLASARFDPWPPPAADGFADPLATGVAYSGLDVATCLAEVFQSRRTINRCGGAQFSAFTPLRGPRLIDPRAPARSRSAPRTWSTPDPETGVECGRTR